MVFDFLFHPEAENEFVHALEFYPENPQAELFQLVHSGIFEVRHHPTRWPVILRKRGFDIRKRMIPRFPHRIIYTEHPQGTILILAIAHGKREPGYWMERIPEIKTPS
ncbi:MAG: type II toxin-antitoxin system RelE/ParE family toxin [Candidatus Sumerlaeia bacterium]|nr:type II toxin-antitoxin system RelE/ParE family toxin [Candidatus Sumerlaeia bacterium]